MAFRVQWGQEVGWRVQRGQGLNLEGPRGQGVGLQGPKGSRGRGKMFHRMRATFDGSADDF